jgi:hypothetical protein
VNQSAPTLPPQLALDALQHAAELNREDPLRRGSLLAFPNYGQLVMTGDMHGHKRNFEKLRQYAALDRAPHRHVMLHELIHADPPAGEPDMSHQLLIEAALYKCEFPDQVHYIQSNHELAQLTGQHITKAGRDVTTEFNAAVLGVYGTQHGHAVIEAIEEFLRSLPVAARTENRVWISHSLPNERDLRSFDPTIVERGEFSRADLADGGSVYQLVWGRRHTTYVLDLLSRAWDVDWFIIGHQPQETGYAVQHDRLIILASDHNHGTFLPIDLGRAASLDSLESGIRKFVAVA